MTLICQLHAFGPFLLTSTIVEASIALKGWSVIEMPTLHNISNTAHRLQNENILQTKTTYPNLMNFYGMNESYFSFNEKKIDKPVQPA